MFDGGVSAVVVLHVVCSIPFPDKVCFSERGLVIVVILFSDSVRASERSRIIVVRIDSVRAFQIVAGHLCEHLVLGLLLVLCTMRDGGLTFRRRRNHLFLGLRRFLGVDSVLDSWFTINFFWSFDVLGHFFDFFGVLAFIIVAVHLCKLAACCCLFVDCI